jgi:sec-independent protein translocase protein TatB
VFNITGGELIIVLILALVVLGPDKLPDFVRRAGRVYGEVKRMSTGFRTEFRDAIDEPVREMQDTMNVARSWFDEGIAEVKDLGDDLRTAADFTDADDDPNFYDDEGRLITALPAEQVSPASAPDADQPGPRGENGAERLPDVIDSDVDADETVADSGSVSDAFGERRRPVLPDRRETADGSVDAFGGLTRRPRADGTAT